MKKPIFILYVFIAALLVVATLFGLIQAIAFSPGFYEREYRKLGQAQTLGMSHEDLMKVTGVVIEQMTGKRDDIEVRVEIDGEIQEAFGWQEKVHMDDVRALLRGFDIFKWVIFGVAAIALAGFFFLCKEGRVRTLSKIMLTAVAGVAVVVGALGIWAAADFNSFWTAFHEILFTNDLWLFDSSSVLINMFPSQFFFDFVMRFLLFAGLAIGMPVVLSGAGLVFTRRRAPVDG